jgi:hypothetical protein
MARKKNVLAPNDEKSLMALDKMSAEIEKAREAYGDGQPFDEERILDCIVFKAERSSQELYDLGKYCLWLKAEVGHGRFTEDLQRKEINVRAAQWAMLMVEKFGDKYDTVSHLGTRKARFLTTFTKEEIDTYAEGGPLGNIPHDDVAKMSTPELQETVRKEKKHSQRIKDDFEKKLADQKAEIEQLQGVIDYRAPLAEKERAEKAAAALLEDLRKKLFGEIQLARFHFGEAVGIVTTAQKTEGASFALLEKWAMEEYEELAGFNELFEELDEALKYCRPDKGDGEQS